MSTRIQYQEGIELFQKATLDELREKAMEVRFEKNPNKRVTFVLDSNPNYTNICNADCSFCAFYRHKGVKDAYTKSIEQVMEHFELARKAGLTTVLLQGGLNDDLKLDYYVELIQTACERYPDVHLHGFSAPELWNVARVSQMSVRDTLQALWDAGLRTIPGGGAEVLSERVRLEISPQKMEPGAWIELHQIAHEIGYLTTATMMYGHVEDPEDIITHFEVLRQAQDKIPGFTAFIPWSYKRDRTALRRKVKNWAGDDAYLRIIAFARIYLDNFDHIQASWFSEGREVGIRALNHGADDFGGIILEENVHRATGHVYHIDHNDVLEMITEAGYQPAQRNTFYDILREYDLGERVFIPEEQRVKDETRLVGIGKEL